MKTQFVFVWLLAILFTITACAPKEKYAIGENYYGFKLVEKKFVEEVNAECFYFKHEKSGARLLKIAAADPNKLFNIAFQTAPETDYGTPHILEHAVLNGSTNFPVKSPFEVLMKGSLNTFLNAMTTPDLTTYPVGSMNDKDYFNLMHVYLDAVFNPLIYSDPKILQQEGWHYELDAKEDDLIYKGVVYNEMKGAYSSPQRELGYQVQKILFPDNTYGVSSGGYPNEIPNLTQEYFIDFHKKYYHPSNSYILLYGDANMDRELEFIDREYLTNYEKSDKVVEIPKQKPFAEMKTAVKTYAVQEGSPTDAQTFLNISIVAGSTTDRKLSFSLDILSEALVNHESAPLRLALQEAGIGRDVSARMSDSQQNVFGITVQNANPEDAEQFKEIVYSTLEKVSTEGFDKSMLEGIVNRMEFNLKQDDNPQKGLMCAFYSYLGLYLADNPFLGLEYKKPLEEIKKGIENKALAAVVKEHLLNNSHAVLFTLKPEPGLQAKIDAKVAEELQAYKAGLSESEIEKIIKETKELKEHQKREDSPEALATIPMLELNDISSEIEWFGVEEKSLADVPVLHHNTFTNSILYTNLYFDIRALPEELIPYSKLLSYLMGKLSTENYTYGELDNALNIHTGRFSTSLSTYFEDLSDDNLIPKFVVSAKATTDKAEKLFELSSEIINTSDFSDTERLKELLSRHQSRLDASVKNNGLNYAIDRMMSYYSNSGVFNELTRGLEYYRFITDISENFDEKGEEVLANLTKTADLLFSRNNLVGTVTCNDEDYVTYSRGAEKFAGTLKDSEVTLSEWEFDLEKKNEGMLTASKVQYVVKGYNFKKLGYEYDGKIRVLNQIISTDWLQNQIRVIGGAYGGFCGFNSTGNVYFASYRDPNLKETFENYDNTPSYLDEFEADEKLMTRYIIGTVAGMDRPMTAAQMGARAVQYYFEKTTPEELKAEREAVLSTTVEDIKGMRKMVEDVLSQDVICVYGNEEKVKENEDLFGEVISLNE